MLKTVNHGRKLVKAQNTKKKKKAGHDWSPVGRLTKKKEIVLAVSLPPAADARHVRLKLAGQAAAGAALQEGGPDGRLKQLPPVLVQFWGTRKESRRWWLISRTLGWFERQEFRAVLLAPSSCSLDCEASISCLF